MKNFLFCWSRAMMLWVRWLLTNCSALLKAPSSLLCGDQCVEAEEGCHAVIWTNNLDNNTKHWQDNCLLSVCQTRFLVASLWSFIIQRLQRYWTMREDICVLVKISSDVDRTNTQLKWKTLLGPNPFHNSERSNIFKSLWNGPAAFLAFYNWYRLATLIMHVISHSSVQILFLEKSIFFSSFSFCC